MVNIPGIDIREKLKQFIFPRTKGGLQDLPTPEVTSSYTDTTPRSSSEETYTRLKANDLNLKSHLKEAEGKVGNKIYVAVEDLEKGQDRTQPKPGQSVDIGYGHKLTKKELKTGKIYDMFDIYDSEGNAREFSEKELDTILELDILKHKKDAVKNFNKHVKNVDFFDLPVSGQHMLIDYDFNGIKPEKLPKALANKDYDKVVKEGTDRSGKIFGVQKFLGRNQLTFKNLLVPLLSSSEGANYSDEKIAELFSKIPKAGTKVASRYQGGMVERDPYKRQPRFI
tara:strand:+ start:130 stop:975 length:846 start_codon:yes stop_codon:yes gene_type:complete